MQTYDERYRGGRSRAGDEVKFRALQGALGRSLVLLRTLPCECPLGRSQPVGKTFDSYSASVETASDACRRLPQLHTLHNNMRQLKHHEKKLLKRVDFLQWKNEHNLRELQVGMHVPLHHVWPLFDNGSCPYCRLLN